MHASPMPDRKHQLRTGSAFIRRQDFIFEAHINLLDDLLLKQKLADCRCDHFRLLLPQSVSMPILCSKSKEGKGAAMSHEQSVLAIQLQKSKRIQATSAQLEVHGGVASHDYSAVKVEYA
eukprot:6182709-Pleurochrysis_carterae.AAC.4